MDNQRNIVKEQVVVANPHSVTTSPHHESVRVINRGISGGKLAAVLIVAVVLSVLIGAGSMLMIFHFYIQLIEYLLQKYIQNHHQILQLINLL